MRLADQKMVDTIQAQRLSALSPWTWNSYPVVVNKGKRQTGVALALRLRLLLEKPRVQGVAADAVGIHRHVQRENEKPKVGISVPNARDYSRGRAGLPAGINSQLGPAGVSADLARAPKSSKVFAVPGRPAGTRILLVVIIYHRRDPSRSGLSSSAEGIARL